MEELSRIAPYGYFYFNDSGIILDANDSCHKLLAYDHRELINQPVERIFPVATKIFYQTHFFPLLKMQGHAEEIFLMLIGRNGSLLPVLLNANKQTNGSETIFACAFIVVRHRKQFEDELVTARKQAEKALAENIELERLRNDLVTKSELLDQQLQRANLQAEELHQLTRVISHEMQEPVRKIAVFSQLLTEAPGGSFDSKDILKRLTLSTLQMKTIVFGLQRYLWLHDASVNYVDIDIKDILLKTRDQLLSGSVSTNLELQIGEIPLIQGDAAQIQILVAEILANAMKFHRPGQPAKITVKATLLKKNSFTALADHYNYAEYIKIDFIDEGKGFENEFRQEVLQLFYRLEPNEGRGVGLALCKKVVENHQGFIEVYSVPGKGTTVTAILPFSPSRSMP